MSENDPLNIPQLSISWHFGLTIKLTRNLGCRGEQQRVRSVLFPSLWSHFCHHLPLLAILLNHGGQFRFHPRMIWNGWRLRSIIYLLCWIINVFPILFPISNCIHLYSSPGVIYSVKLQYKNVADNTIPAVETWPKFAHSEHPLIIKLLGRN